MGNWFESNIVYEGYGRAEFENPKGYVEGPVRIKCDETGDNRIEMTEVTDYRNESALGGDFDLYYLLTGIRPATIGGGSMIGFPIVVRNRCVRLEVNAHTPPGTFTFDTGISHVPNGLTITGQTTSILFRMNRFAFTAISSQEPVYWALPLENFIPDGFVQQETTRTPHPLRIDSKNSWISFTFNGTPAFVDQLVDYEDRKKQLTRGTAKKLLTAVMVGDVGKNVLDWSDIPNWLPFDFIETVLGLATGTRVTVPWIEFRDKTGELVKRLHMISSTSEFHTGHRAIRAFHQGGIGGLLSDCQNSTYYRNRGLRVVMNRLISAGNETLTVEERLSLVFRAYEALQDVLEIESPKTIDLLTKENYKKVKHILKKAQSKINAIADRMVSNGQDSSEEEKAQTQRIKRIAKRMFSPTNVNLSFGDLVTILCRLKAKALEFADIDVARLFFGDERKWQEKLESVRAKIMHGDAFGTSDELTEGGRLLWHLHDLGLRIVLKLLNYNGRYYPVVANLEQSHANIDSTLDWVKPDTSPSDLGYI